MLMVISRVCVGIHAIDIGGVMASTVGEVCGTVQHGLLPKVVGFGGIVVSGRSSSRSGLSVRNRAHARRPRAVTVAIHMRRC